MSAGVITYEIRDEMFISALIGCRWMSFYRAIFMYLRVKMSLFPLLFRVPVRAYYSALES